MQTTARYAHLKADQVPLAADKVAEAIATTLARPVKNDESDAA